MLLVSLGQLCSSGVTSGESRVDNNRRRRVTAMDYRINELGRFRVLLGGLSASLCISVLYGFNLLSNYLQKEYDLNASDLTTITTTGIVVGFVTFPGGMLLDYVGPMWVLIIATTSCALGAFLFGLAFQGLIA
ncbi:putative membrane transporter, partial [Trypanosoma conorhini]